MHEDSNEYRASRQMHVNNRTLESTSKPVGPDIREKELSYCVLCCTHVYGRTKVIFILKDKTTVTTPLETVKAMRLLARF